MLGIILASHGGFAKGIKESAQMIFGDQEKFESVILLPSMGPNDFRKNLEDVIDRMNTDEILFLIDLRGGTPFNQVSNLLEDHKDKRAIVTGLNLPMVIEALSERMNGDSSHSIAKKVIGAAKDGIKIKAEDLNELNDKIEEKTKNFPKGSIPEGTVLGNGKIDIALARIDTRLLHGQVATSWTKSVNPDRIIVVSDSVSQDDLRKQMVMEAAPPGVKSHVVPIWKMKEIMDDPRFGATRAMLLFEKPQDVLKFLEMGANLDQINLGSMAYKKGDINLTNAVSMNANDVECFDKILNYGVKIDVRKVPSDKSENFANMMKKAKSELNIN
ncbi:MAG: PTS sugar transporter subunit IIB [Anaerococcus sp.]|nr:PTS sugar transporter subunit IIB [Peptoniphilaceae bacterium]MDY2918130.1 PTS sugar transporter subunit IIB [Anaerococcus sp.]